MTADVRQPQRKIFSDRVRYAARSLRRGHAGPAFEKCFAEADSQHVAAVLIRRAEKSPDLKAAIMNAFKVSRWEDVPWNAFMSRFQGMDSRAIGEDAQRALDEADRMMGDGLLTGVR